MRNRLFILLSMLLYFSPILYGLEKLPDDIFIKNHEQGFSYEYLYALKDGKIWIKPNKKNTGREGEWELFDGTGLPHGDTAESFKDGDRIVQFSTEGTMIAALSSSGRFYLWQPTLKEKTTWLEETGSPFADALYVPKNKIWCFSLSTMRAPWKRLTPMHENDIVTCWEDIDGNRTEFGFTATVYMAAPDGRRILYTDTGLPASWSRACASPERGRFIIEKMSASASSILVMNKTGKMYTRMIDFEMEGGCPALRFVYTRGKRTKGDEVAPLMESIRTLPIPDWREQEPVSEVLADRKNGSGKAVITGNITVVLTGKGNAARELRVQGRDGRGNYGYWKKMIYDSRWDFVATGEKFSDSDIIKNYLDDAPQGETSDKNYKGKLTMSGEPDLSVELIGFYYFNTPAVLRVYVNGKFFDIKFHTVDLWSPTLQKKYYPELIGNPSGEPKLLQAAIEIPEYVLNSADPDIKNAVDKYFREFNLQPIAFTVSADDRNVYIESKTLQRSLDKNLDYECRSDIKMELINDEYDKLTHASMFYTSMAIRPVLEISEKAESLTGEDIPSVEKLIVLNQNTLDNIKKTHKKLKHESCVSGCANSCILPVYYIFNSCVTVLFLPHWDMSDSSPGTAENVIQLGGVSYTGGTPLKEHAAMNLKEAFEDPEDYKLAVKIMEERITKLNGILEALKKNVKKP